MKKILLSFLFFLPSIHAHFDSRTKEIFYLDQAFNSQPKKPWTFIVYMASDNDLFYFTKRNLDDMKKVGSNQNLNIVVQMDPTGISGSTKRLYVGYNKIYQVNSPTSQEKQDAGSEKTLIECCKWAIQNYPAQNYALILWNHGSGILDSVGGKLLNATELFRLNPQTGYLELDRTLSFLHYAEAREKKRGVCFSDTYGTFLTNQKLEYALREVVKILPKGKFDLIGFDACLMAMAEVANLIRPYASYMAASEEVELGTGWAYNLVLQPFLRSVPTPAEFGVHIANSFRDFYLPITQDFTFSCIDLSKTALLEKALNTACYDLLDALEYQEYDSVYRSLKNARKKNACTHFAEPSYIDLDHFLKNIYESIPTFKLRYNEQTIKDNLRKSILAVRAAISQCVLNNVTGANVRNAKGIAIYFPLYVIDRTYGKTPFASETRWLSFIQKAL